MSACQNEGPYRLLQHLICLRGAPTARRYCRVQTLATTAPISSRAGDRNPPEGCLGEVGPVHASLGLKTQQPATICTHRESVSLAFTL